MIYILSIYYFNDQFSNVKNGNNDYFYKFIVDKIYTIFIISTKVLQLNIFMEIY